MANDAAFRNPFFKVSKTLVKADLGTKRVCPSCAARFYDLEKRPIECPKCAFSFEPEAMYKQRRTRQPEPVAETKGTPAETDDEDSDDEEEAEEAESDTIVEPVEGEAPLKVASDDDDEDEDEETAAPEVEAEEAGMQVVEDADALEDLETDDVDEDEDDDSLLEADEEDGDDVSDIIDTDIEKDER